MKHITRILLIISSCLFLGGCSPKNTVNRSNDALDSNKEDTHPDTAVEENKPDYLKENIPGTKWTPIPEQVAEVQKDYHYYHFEELSCDNPNCDDDDDDDETLSIIENAQANDPQEQEKEQQQKKAIDEYEKWHAAYELASAKFCSKLDLPPNVNCKATYKELYITCDDMDINTFLGYRPYQIYVHENTKAFQVEFDWNHPLHANEWYDRSYLAEDLKTILQRVECVESNGNKYWKCIHPNGCGNIGCYGLAYSAKVNDEYKCICPHTKYPANRFPDDSFICQLDLNDRPGWFCDALDGCDFFGEKIPYGKSLSCLESGSEFIYNSCYCNGIKRSFADTTPCKEPLDSAGNPLKDDGFGVPQKIYADEVPYLKEIKPGQFCDRTNGCMCEGNACPQSGICTLKGCVDAVTGTLFARSDGYWVSGLYKQCDEIKGCPCGEKQCNYGDTCLNNWFCSDRIKTEIHNRKRYIYDDGERYRKNFEGWVGEYDSEPCDAEIMKDLPTQYACMYAFDISDCTDGCLGGLDEVDYEGIPIARCASSEGCPCGDSVCPQYARCILNACYYDKMYEVIMCGGDVSDIVSISQRIALDPADDIDVSGNCLVEGYIRPPKFNDVVTNYPKQPIDLLFNILSNHPEILIEDNE